MCCAGARTVLTSFDLTRGGSRTSNGMGGDSSETLRWNELMKSRWRPSAPASLVPWPWNICPGAKLLLRRRRRTCLWPFTITDHVHHLPASLIGCRRSITSLSSFLDKIIKSWTNSYSLTLITCPPPLTSRGGYLTCSRIDLIISQARADHFPGTLAPGHATGCIASLSNLIKFQSF